MKEEYHELPLYKNNEKQRFELEVDGFMSFIDFQEDDQIIKLIHTESPEELSGRGVAKALVEKTLNYLEENAYQLVPLCPYVFAYIKRHTEWKRIVTADFTGFENS